MLKIGSTWAHGGRIARALAPVEQRGWRKAWTGTLAVFVLASGMVLAVATEAGATTTLLNNTTFLTNSIGGGWVQPTAAAGTNGACLTAGPTVATSVVPNCSPAPDTSGSGALQFTSNATTKVGSTYYQVSMPTTQGLDMNFETYQYNGTGADGISFSLAAVNPAAPAAPATTGQSGGSLGYSPNGAGAGLPYGYLGLGLDVYGNYENTTYNGTGCSTPSGLTAGKAYPESVTARGPGNGLAGYCILNSTAQSVGHVNNGSNNNTITNLSATQGAGGEYLDNNAATSRSSVQVPVEVVLNPSATASPAQTSGLNVPANSYLVAYKALNSSGWQSITGPLPTTTNNTELATFPASWIDAATGLPDQLALGWTSSTGGATEIHELNNFSASSFNGAVPVSAVTSTDNQSGQFLAGGTTTFTVTPGLSASGGSEDHTVTMVDTFPAGITPGTATGTGWVCATSGQKVTCTYTPGSPLAAGSSFPAISIPGAVASNATGSLTSSVEVSSDDGLYGAASDTGTVYSMSASSTATTYPNAPTLSVAHLPPVATGTLTFTTGATTWCTATLPATSCAPTSVTAGSYTVTAAYSGDPNFSTATATATMAVAKDTTATTVSEAPTTVIYGNEAATLFHVAVTTGNGETVPDGETVSVSAGCTVTLSAGSGTCTVANTALPAGGPSAVSATYVSDANLGSSTGNAGTGVTVSKDTSVTALTATPGAQSYGSEAATQFSVTVTTGNAEALPASGETVTVHVGAASCVATLVQQATGGTGACSISNAALPVASYVANATYAGDADISASPGPGTANFSVNGAPTTTVLSPVASSTPFGGETAETFTAHVTSAQGTPTGTVTVSGSTGTLCTIALSSGTGSCSLTATQLTPQSVGSVVATYNASGNFAGSASSPSQNFTVVTDATTTAVTATPASAAYGSESATSFAVAVTTAHGNPIANSGETITVNVGSTSCVATLTALGQGGLGTCTIVDSALPVGSYTASAKYGGDADFAASPGPGTAAFSVTMEPTTTTVSLSNATLIFGAESLETFNVHVAATDSATVPNGETVLVAAGSATCTVTLSAGAGSCSLGVTALPSGGPNAVTATYGGDGNLGGSSGNDAQSVTVTSDSTTTTLTATPASATFGTESATAFNVVVTTGNGEVLPASGEQVTVNVGTANCVATLMPGGHGGSGSCSISDAALPSGSYTASATYGGDGDLLASPSAGTAPFAVTGASTTTTLSALANTTYGGETSETFSVTESSGAGTPGGTVTLTSDQGPLCSFTLSAGAGTCALSATQLPAGAVTNVVATYSGDPDFGGSASAPQGFSVAQDSTVTAVTATPSSAAYGNEGATSFAVAVTTAHGEPLPASGETTTISIGAAQCVATLTPGGSGATGQCAIADTALATGPSTASATYGGDADLLASPNAGTAPFTVTKDASTTTITASPAADAYGNEAATTFTVNVATANGEAIPGNGETVVVTIGTASCTVTLIAGAPGAAGTCSIATTALPAGHDTATATYGGDPSVSPSPAASTPFTVNPDTTVTQVAVMPTAQNYGSEAVSTFAVAVQTGHGEMLPASGETVTVHVGTAMCVATLTPVTNGGLGSCQIANTDLPAGTYTASATYGGDGSLLASPGPGTAGFTVAPDGTTTSLSALPASVAYGNEATTSFAVTVATANGEAIPSNAETVVVTVGSAHCTVTLAPASPGGSGSCSITNTALPADGYTASATYGGDPSEAASTTTATAPFTVTKAASTMTISVAPNPVAAQQNVTYTASGLPAGATGTVTFTTGTTTLCVATLPAVSCTASNAPVGSDTIVASYSGDANHAPSAPPSATATLVVNAPPVAHDASGSGADGHVVTINLPTPTGAGPFVYTVTQPQTADGKCAISNSGVLTFTPVPGYSGTATCAYTVTDAHGLTSSPATATIDIAAAGTPLPAAHTGQPWSGWPYWLGLALMFASALVLVRLGRRVHQR